MTNPYYDPERFQTENDLDKEFLQKMTDLIRFLQGRDNDTKYSLLADYYNSILYKYKEQESLDSDSLIALVNEQGYKYVTDLFILSEDTLRTLIGYLPIINAFKGTRVGFQLFLDVIGLNILEIIEWHEEPNTYDPGTFSLEIDAVAQDLDQDFQERFRTFIQNYVYPIYTLILDYYGSFGVDLTSDIQGIWEMEFDWTVSGEPAAIIKSQLSDELNLISFHLFNNRTGTTISDLSGNDLDIALSSDANTLTPTGYSLKFGTSDIYTIADSDLLSFGNGSTDSAFSIIVKMKPTSTSNCILSKVDITTGSTKREWSLEWGSDKLYAICYDDSASGKISRYANTSLASDTDSFHHYAITYDGSSSSSGLKIYRDSSRIDDTDNSSGSYTAMENLGSAVGNYAKNSSGVVASIGAHEIAAIIIVTEELSADQLLAISTDLDALITAYAS